MKLWISLTPTEIICMQIGKMFFLQCILNWEESQTEWEQIADFVQFLPSNVQQDKTQLANLHLNFFHAICNKFTRKKCFLIS